MIYFAPLEGITSYLYRKTHQEFFGGVDCYYTPFICPSSNRNFKSKEKKDILPENNEGVAIVPQILSNRSDEFIYTAKCLKEYGYEEVNLNLGCPSGTVVSKGRGSGFLERRKELERFLDEIYHGLDMKISIKTRLGMYEPEEFESLLLLYNQYPISELTIHPRTRTDQYKGAPHREWFDFAYKKSKNPLCYNGDILTKDDYRQLHEKYPNANVMIGRGLLTNPFLAAEIAGTASWNEERIWQFEHTLRQRYKEIMPPVPVLFKMKEIWAFMIKPFEDKEKKWKQIRKAKKLSDYENIICSLGGVR
ncbi:MAG: tRNA-dihydrouridine synthase family protein [Eubacterium sp.]|nr:tRNA-dihydrouridine synthase family protein [Eubacterium sp.]